MKTRNLLRSLLAVFAIVCLFVNSNAQQVTSAYTSSQFADTTTVNETYDYVTVGSTMPYYITPDPDILLLRKAMVYKPSEFYWDINKAGVWTSAGNYAIADSTGGALDLASGAGYNAAAPYTLDSAISVNWMRTGAYTIWMREHPATNNSGLVACDGPLSRLQVDVLSKPTVEWNDRADSVNGGCSVNGTTINVTVDLTGSDEFSITYDSVTRNLDGTPVIGKSGTRTVVYHGAQAIWASRANSETNVKITNWVPAPAFYGSVSYTITSISDRIARKSYSRNHTGYGAIAGYTLANNATGTGVTMSKQTYKLYALPTPSTRAIRHVTNNVGW